MAMSQRGIKSQVTKSSTKTIGTVGDDITTVKTAPICKKCGAQHWPFHSCGGKEKNEMNKGKEQPLSEIITETNPSLAEKFAPVCRICGNKHWPLDPSCIGRKGVKAEARKKAKAEREAKSEAKAKVKAERIARAEVESRAKAEAKARVEAEAKTRAEVEKRAKVEAQAEEKIKSFAEEIAKVRAEAAQAEESVKAESEARALAEREWKAELEQKTKVYEEAAARAEEKAKTYADELTQLKERLRAEIKARTRAENKARTESERRTRLEAKLKSRGGARAERIARARAKARAKAEKETYSAAIAKAEEQLKAEAMARAEAEGRLKAETHERARLEAQAEEKIKSFAEEIAKSRAEAADTVAKVKAEFEEKNRLYPETRQKNGAKVIVAEMVDGTFENTLEEKRVCQTTGEELSLNRVGGLLAICAQDIMQENIVWGSPDDSVQEALTKMQSHGTDHVIIGQDGTLEGIVSKSDLTAAISPYLRPEFAKWRRPLDDATLQIKIKWIMSRPVRTVKPETPLSDIIGNMCQFGGCALPVVDQQGKVQGLVTAFNILKVRSLLKTESEPGIIAKRNKAPRLSAGTSSSLSPQTTNK